MLVLGYKKKIDAVKSKYWARFFLVLPGRTWLNDDNAALDQVNVWREGGRGGGWIRSMKGNSKESFPQGEKKVSLTACHLGKL